MKAFSGQLTCQGYPSLICCCLSVCVRDQQTLVTIFLLLGPRLTWVERILIEPTVREDIVFVGSKKARVRGSESKRERERELRVSLRILPMYLHVPATKWKSHDIKKKNTHKKPPRSFIVYFCWFLSGYIFLHVLCRLPFFRKCQDPHCGGHHRAAPCSVLLPSRNSCTFYSHPLAAGWFM